ncbi:hypothetical protein BGU70_18845, partial [Clostridioides difficile]|uniref:hypothetical protein n=1 Tax=Clostridioides difficile TaxID=1496 RepID=UPI000BD3A244
RMPTSASKIKNKTKIDKGTQMEQENKHIKHHKKKPLTEWEKPIEDNIKEINQRQKVLHT